MDDGCRKKKFGGGTEKQHASAARALALAGAGAGASGNSITPSAGLVGLGGGQAAGLGESRRPVGNSAHPMVDVDWRGRDTVRLRNHCCAFAMMMMMMIVPTKQYESKILTVLAQSYNGQPVQLVTQVGTTGTPNHRSGGLCCEHGDARTSFG